MNGVRIGLLFAACWLLCGPPAMAHELATARLGLTDEGAGAYRLTARLGAGAPIAVTPALPGGCAVVDAARRPAPGGLQVHEWRLTCADGGADGEIGLPLGVEDATVVTRSRAGTEHTFQMRAQDGRIVLPLAASLVEGQSALELARRQVELGIGHILSGFDHLALLLCLCLVASGWSLVRLITGFTVGHSLTLALATLGWVSFPAPLIEALIALSIAFLAREVLIRERSSAPGFWLVVGFGLLHGLGFAGALADLGLPRSDLLVALLGFNIGVEIGQLLFVGALVSAGALLRMQVAMPAIRTPAAFALGTAATYWTIERVLQFSV